VKGRLEASLLVAEAAFRARAAPDRERRRLEQHHDLAPVAGRRELRGVSHPQGKREAGEEGEEEERARHVD
jgi:hypothetical protein